MSLEKNQPAEELTEKAPKDVEGKTELSVEEADKVAGGFHVEE